MANKSHVCSECGTKIVTYRFCFNKGLAAFLKALYLRNEPTARTDDLGLTYSQRTNSQKLRYWGLAVPAQTSESRRKAGVWKITDAGIAFIQGRIKIPKYAFTEKGVVTGTTGPEIGFSEVNDGYDYRSDYAQQVAAQLHCDGPFCEKDIYENSTGA